ncbi:ATP-binding protein [Candidatus Desantisbacteria bacterium]|nr:ATP-binding protein [Candidatus Desantisbacteria bacterium]
MNTCNICGGTGWEFIKEGELNTARRCPACYFKKTQIKRLSSALIPSRYEHCTLASYHPQHATQKKAKQIAIRFIEEYPDINSGLFFMGTCGVGKTHLAVATMRSILDKGFSCIFYDFRELLKKLQHSYNTESELTEEEVLKPVIEKDILLLDELGAQKITSWIRDTLTYIINRRYNDNKITIITSNYMDNPVRSKEGKDEEENLTDRIGYRLRSRLNEMCKVVVMDGQDFRLNRQTALQHHEK